MEPNLLPVVVVAEVTTVVVAEVVQGGDRVKRVVGVVVAPVILVVLPVAKLLPEITRVTALRK